MDHRRAMPCTAAMHHSSSIHAGLLPSADHQLLCAPAGILWLFFAFISSETSSLSFPMISVVNPKRHTPSLPCTVCIDFSSLPLDTPPLVGPHTRFNLALVPVHNWLCLQLELDCFPDKKEKGKKKKSPACWDWNNHQSRVNSHRAAPPDALLIRSSSATQRWGFSPGQPSTPSLSICPPVPETSRTQPANPNPSPPSLGRNAALQLPPDLCSLIAVAQGCGWKWSL